jgi:hypothetical protein
MYSNLAISSQHNKKEGLHRTPKSLGGRTPCPNCSLTGCLPTSRIVSNCCCTCKIDRSATKTKHSRWFLITGIQGGELPTRQISLNISCWKMVNFPLWVQQIMNSIISNVIYSRWLSYCLPPHRPVILVMNYEAESATYGAFPIVKVL